MIIVYGKDAFYEKAYKDFVNIANGLEKEIAILTKYLPEQLTEEEVRVEIDKVFDKVKPTSMKDMGVLMKELTAILKGKAGMKLVNTIIKEKLN